MAVELSPDELRVLIGLAKRALWSPLETRRALQANGVNLTPANFYSDIPLIADVEDSFEYIQEADGTAPYDFPGLFDRTRIQDFIQSIAGYADEFDPPVDGDVTNPAGFFWGNPAFSRTDAMLYYCILRATRPKRVLETGSGFSTLVANQALLANGSGELIVIEPYPKDFLRSLPTISTLIEKKVQSIPEREMVALVESSEVWFIDSTHTVKVGSDCLYMYLKIMPKVRTAVICHTHDVYLPYALPSKWALQKHIYWTEQYLLLAYLLGNSKAEILTGSCFMQRQLRDQSLALMHGRSGDGGGSLWYRLNSPHATADRDAARLGDVMEHGAAISA